jgi:DNA-binding transcriptional LysR family regulator
LAANPQVDIDLDERPSLAVAQAVVEGLADIGIAADHADFTGLETFPFQSDRLVLALPHGHGLAGLQHVSFAEALSSDFIGLAGDSALHQHLVGHATRAGMPMRLRARAHGVDVVCRMVSLGAGAAVVPETAARRWQQHGELAVVPLTDRWAERRLRIVVRRMDALPSQARRLVEHLLAAGDPAATPAAARRSAPP